MYKRNCNVEIVGAIVSKSAIIWLNNMLKTATTRRKCRDICVVNIQCSQAPSREPKTNTEMKSEMYGPARCGRESQRVAESDKQAYHQIEAEPNIHAKNEARSQAKQYQLETHLRTMRARCR